jgi:hypothetical protein
VNFAGAATTLAIGAAASTTTLTGQALTFTGLNGVNNTTLLVRNTSNTAATAEHAIVDIAVGGTTTIGDPQLRFTTGGTNWYMGVDNDGLDAFVLGIGTVLGSSLRLTLTETSSGSNADNESIGGAAWQFGVRAFTLDGGGATQTVRGAQFLTHTLSISDGVQRTILFAGLESRQMTINRITNAVTVNKATGGSFIGPAAGTAVTLTHSSALRALTGGTAVNASGTYYETQTAGTPGNYQSLYAVSTGASPALADHVGINAKDIAAGDTRLEFQSEAGSAIYIGNDQLRFAGATASIRSGATDLISLTSSSVVVNEGLGDIDFRIESAGNANMFVVDAGNNGVGIGTTHGGTFEGTLVVAPRAITSSGASQRALNAVFTDATVAIGAQTGDVFSVWIDGNAGLTASAATTVVNSASLYINKAPVAGSNVTITNDYAFWVDSGKVRLDGGGTSAQITAQGGVLGILASTVNGNNASSTIAIGTAVNIPITTYTNNTATLTMTDAVSLYIAGVPVASTNVAFTNTALALWVDAGASRFDGTVEMQSSAGIGFAGASTGSGLNVGAASTNNSIWSATQGAASTQLFIGNASINVTSDARVKTDIVPYNGDALSVLSTLQVSSYKYLPGYELIGGYTGTFVGFTAQDLVNVAPWAVNTQGNSDGTSLLTADNLPWQARFELLNGLIVKGIQELSTKVASLSGQLAIDASGNLIVGGASTTTTINGITRVDTSALGVGNNNALCHLGAGGAGEIVGDCPGTPADVAEYYETDGTIQAGDAVALVDAATLQVKQAVAGDEKLAVGVISTLPNLAIGELENALYPKPVALVGRVPVRVSTANGPIEPGDSLALSNIPGVLVKATKAGVVMGRAMEGFDGTAKRSSKTQELIAYMEGGKYEERQIEETRQKLQKAIDALNREFSSDQGLILMYVSIGWMGNDLAVQENSSGQLVNLDPEQLRTGLASLGLIVNPNGTLDLLKLGFNNDLFKSGLNIESATQFGLITLPGGIDAWDMKGKTLANVFGIFSAYGTWSIDESGNLNVKKITAKEIETEKLRVTNAHGVTITDSATGLPACVTSENYQLKIIPGTCESINTNSALVNSAVGSLEPQIGVNQPADEQSTGDNQSEPQTESTSSLQAETQSESIPSTDSSQETVEESVSVESVPAQETVPTE